MTQDRNAAAGDDPFLSWMIGLAIGAAALWGLWLLFHGPIATVITWVRIGELWALGWFSEEMNQLRLYLMTIDPYRLTFSDIVAMSKATGQYIRYLAGPVILGMGVWAGFFSPGTKWRRRHDLESLIKTQAQTWKVIAPITLCNPAQNTRSTKGAISRKLEPWAEHLTPNEWAALEGLTVSKEGKVDVAAAKTAFSKQLCGRWRGFQALPWYLRALVAAIALKTARQRDDCRELLGEIAVCWSPDGGMRENKELGQRIANILADQDLMRPLEEVTQRHAWTATVLLALVQQARDCGGVLASSEFLWLRPTYRALWYPLNGLGGHAFYTEAAGAMSHYMAELAANKPLTEPAMESATQGLERYFQERDSALPKVKEG